MLKGLKKTAVLLTAALLTGTLSDVSGKLTVCAASNTRQEIEQREQEKEQLESQLGATQDNLANLKGEKNSLNGQLNNLNVQLAEISARLEELEQSIEEKERDISDTQAALQEARETERWQHDSMIIRVQEMYEYGETGYLDAILNAGSLMDMVMAADFFERISSYSQAKLEEFRENRRLIEELEASLQNDMAQLESMRTDAQEEQNRVNGLIRQTTSAINQYSSQISATEQEALNYEARIKEKEEDLTYLRKRLAEEIAMSQKAAGGTWRDISEVTFAEGDRKLLANLIYCEAGGEPYEGKLAVGSVVINRVLSSVYPDTVVGVIYQNRQFSPVASGRLALALTEDRATESCYQAADAAMAGMNNIGSCVYFRTPVEGLEGINIGGHVFY